MFSTNTELVQDDTGRKVRCVTYLFLGIPFWQGFSVCRSFSERNKNTATK